MAREVDIATMLTMNKAKLLALDGIATRTGHPRGDILILDELTQCRRYGWVFFYESRAFLETGDAARAIGHTGPVVVTHLEGVHYLPGDRPAEDVLRAYEAAQRVRVPQR